MLVDIPVLAQRPAVTKPVIPSRPRGVLKRSLLAHLETGPKTASDLAAACDCRTQAVYTVLSRCGIFPSADGYYRISQ